MIFDCHALGKFYRGDYLLYSHILPNALFCVLFVLQEVTSIRDSYRKKAKMTTEVLNLMENGRYNVCVSENNTSKESYRGSLGIMSCFRSWGPFLESPGNFSGPRSNIQIEISRVRARVLASRLLHFVSLTDGFIMLDAKLLRPRSLM